MHGDSTLKFEKLDRCQEGSNLFSNCSTPLRRPIREKIKRESPEAFDATSSFINPLFEEGGSGRGSSVNLHTSSLEMTELVDEYVDDKAAKASSLDIREVSGTA